MLMFKAAQVIVATLEEPKAWKMEGREGVTHAAVVCCLGHDGKASNIKIKGKSAEELNAKIGALTPGKPFDLPIIDVVPIFKQGDRRASGYELVADIKIRTESQPTNGKKA